MSVWRHMYVAYVSWVHCLTLPLPDDSYFHVLTIRVLAGHRVRTEWHCHGVVVTVLPALSAQFAGRGRETEKEDKEMKEKWID
jgi:hypothetical protein